MAEAEESWREAEAALQDVERRLQDVQRQLAEAQEGSLATQVLLSAPAEWHSLS